MKTYVPDYYPEFACIAGKCRHSCCVGWEIDIDEDSLARFRQAQGEIGLRLRRDIVETEDGAFFRLKEHDRCPFLNDENLCDLIIALGEESLCQICADHPRFRSFFADRTEMGLGLCCEEAARLILTRTEKTKLMLWEDDGEDDLPDEDEQELLLVRKALIDAVQDRSLLVEERVERMLAMTGIEMPQRRMAEWAGFFLGLERLDEGWTARLNALAQAADGPAANIPDHAQEQLLVYFLTRHMPGAAEDGDMQGRLMLCVLLWQLVQAIAAREQADMEALIDIARMCSSEMEYSDENLQAILDEIADII